MKQNFENDNPLFNAPKPRINITPHSFKFSDVGDTFRGYYLGIKPFPRKNKKTGVTETAYAAYFFDGSRIWHNMGVALLRELNDHRVPIGTALEIVMVNEKQNLSGEGSTKEYDLLPLEIDPIDIRGQFGNLTVGALPAPSDVEGAKEAADDTLRNDIMADIRAKAAAKASGDPLESLGFNPDAPRQHVPPFHDVIASVEVDPIPF